MRKRQTSVLLLVADGFAAALLLNLRYLLCAIDVVLVFWQLCRHSRCFIVCFILRLLLLRCFKQYK